MVAAQFQAHSVQCVACMAWVEHCMCYSTDYHPHSCACPRCRPITAPVAPQAPHDQQLAAETRKRNRNKTPPPAPPASLAFADKPRVRVPIDPPPPVSTVPVPEPDPSYVLQALHEGRPDPRTQPLLGAFEIASELGLSPNTIYKASRAPEFPKPYAVISAGRFWLRADIEQYKKDRLQRGLQPRVAGRYAGGRGRKNPQS